MCIYFKVNVIRRKTLDQSSETCFLTFLAFTQHAFWVSLKLLHCISARQGTSSLKKKCLLEDLIFS